MKTTFQYDHYYDYEELTDSLQQLAKQYPHLVSLNSICTTEKSREVWVATLTHCQTGKDIAKPAFYIDGNTHAGEVTGSMAALHTLDILCTNFNHDEVITDLLNTTTFYIIPRISPDGAQAYLKSEANLRSVDRPYPHLVKQQGLSGQDLDGDGVIRMIRFPSPYGGWKKKEGSNFLMEKRRPDDRQGEFYTILPEGLETQSDELDPQPAQEFWGLDFNRNYPYGWFNEARQPGAGVYPLSNPENKAVVDFVLAHPNIGAVATHHTCGGVLLYPPGTKAEKAANPLDMQRFIQIGELATEEMGYPVINIFDHFMIDQENYSSGAFDDWCFQNQGIPAYTVELWNLLERAGCKIDWDNRAKKTDKEKMEILEKVITWCNQHADSSFVMWKEFDHPQYGKVEIGGMNTKFTYQNCPNSFLLQEVEKTTRFCLRYAKTLPMLSIENTEVTWLDGHFAKISVVVGNRGYLPTYLSNEAKELKLNKSVMVSLQGTGFEIVQGKAIEECKDLEGFSCLPTKISECGYSTGNHEPMQKKISWIVAADVLSEITITAFCQTAGRVCVTLSLQ